MINRKEYLNELIKWKHDNLIKVITGIRRCGKSTLLELFSKHLQEEGVEESQIVSINFENLDNEGLLDYKALHSYIKSRLSKNKWTYVLLDEIQNVKDFQKVVDSLYVCDKVDIYITGSNAYLLSGKLATLLSGRYVEIEMLPFSFREYYDCAQIGDEDNAFLNYMKNGGFPYVSELKNPEDKIDQYLEGIYNTIIIKDVADRRGVNENKSVDVVLLKTITKYLADVIGNPVSIKSIANYLSSNNRKVSDHTVSDYVNALTEAFVFYPVERFDIQGKELLKTNKKFYIVDMGLRNCLLAKRSFDLGFVLENIVYLELKRRGYRVNVGKYGTKEIDFVVQKNGKIEYFQVSASISDGSTFEREIAPLRIVKDNYKKTILTLDKFTVGNYDGIEVKDVCSWLLGYNES